MERLVFLGRGRECAARGSGSRWPAAPSTRIPVATTSERSYSYVPETLEPPRRSRAMVSSDGHRAATACCTQAKRVRHTPPSPQRVPRYQGLRGDDADHVGEGESKGESKGESDGVGYGQRTTVKGNQQPCRLLPVPTHSNTCGRPSSECMRRV